MTKVELLMSPKKEGRVSFILRSSTSEGGPGVEFILYNLAQRASLVRFLPLLSMLFEVDVLKVNVFVIKITFPDQVLLSEGFVEAFVRVGFVGHEDDAGNAIVNQEGGKRGLHRR